MLFGEAKLKFVQELFNIFQAFPKWMKSPEAKEMLNADVIFEEYQNKESLTIVFNIVKVLLETGMFVSAAVGGFLDNTIPGEKRKS